VGAHDAGDRGNAAGGRGISEGDRGMPAGERGRAMGEPPAHDSRLHAALSYALAGFSGIVLLLLRQEDRYVRFHALQSIAISIVALILGGVLWLFSFFPLMGFLYGMLLRVYQIFLFLLWIFLMWQAWRGRWYRLPRIGSWVERQSL